MNKTKAVGFFRLVFAVLLLALVLLPPTIAYAIRSSDVPVPDSQKIGDQVFLAEKYGLKLVFIDRAHILVTFEGEEFFPVEGIGISQDLLGVFTDTNLNGDYQYRRRFDDSSIKDYSNLDEFDDSLDNKANEGPNVANPDQISKVPISNFWTNYLQSVELVIVADEDFFGGGCGFDSPIAPGSSGNNDAYFYLEKSGNSLQWNCSNTESYNDGALDANGDNAGDATGFRIRESEWDADSFSNFNITYRYDGANTLQYVLGQGSDDSENRGGDFNFVYCEKDRVEQFTDISIPSGLGGVFVRNGDGCNGEMYDEYIPHTPESLRAELGTSQEADLTIFQGNKNQSSTREVILAAGPNHDSNQLLQAYLSENTSAFDQVVGGDLETCRAGDGIDGAMGWIICPLVSITLGAVHWVETNVIIPYLTTNPLNPTDGDPIFGLWKAIRNVANAVLVVALLAIVYSQATSAGLDAYQVKRMAPRLVVGAIGIQLSFYLCALIIDLTNILGEGIGSLVATILGQQDDAALVTVDGGVALAGGLTIILALGSSRIRSLLFRGTTRAAGGALQAVGMSAIIGFLLMAFLVIIGVFFTLIIRQMLITLLVIGSPLAIAASLLPNTSNIYDKWQSLFVKTMLMYPIIILLFASGKIFGVVAGLNADNGGGLATASVSSIMSYLANIIPLVIIPFTFGLAGGVLGKVIDLARSGGRSARRATGDRHSTFLRGVNELDDTLRQKYDIRRGERLTKRFQRPGSIAGKLANTKAGKRIGKVPTVNRLRGALEDARVATLERRGAEGWKAAEEFMSMRQNGHWWEAQRYFAQYGGDSTSFKKGLEVMKELERQGKLNANDIRNYESMESYIGNESMGRAALLSAGRAGKLKNSNELREIGEGFKGFYGTSQYDADGNRTGFSFYNGAMASQWEGRVIEGAKSAERKNPFATTMGVQWDYDSEGNKILDSGRVSLIPGTEKQLKTEEGALAYKVTRQGVYAGTESTDHAGMDMIRGTSAMIQGVTGTGSAELQDDVVRQLQYDKDAMQLRAENAARVLEGVSNNPENFVQGARAEYAKIEAAAATGDAGAIAVRDTIKAERDKLRKRIEAGGRGTEGLPDPAIIMPDDGDEGGAPGG